MAVIRSVGGTPVLKFGVQENTLERAVVEAGALGQLSEKGDPTPRFMAACFERGVTSFESDRQSAEMATRLAALEKKVEGISQRIEEVGG